MPFTFCHPAVVLPFNYLNKRVSMVGMVIGSMIPDFEYFIRMKVVSIYSHTWSGLLLFDLPLGLALFLIYQSLVKDKLIDNLPAALHRRFSQYRSIRGKGFSINYLIVVAVSVLVGAASHILWDAFTHPGGYFVLLAPALTNTVQLFHQPIFIYKILQHASSLIGAIAILTIVYHLPLGQIYKVNSKISYWVIVITVMALTLFIKLLLTYHGFGGVIVTAIAGLFLGLIAASLKGEKHSADIDNL